MATIKIGDLLVKARVLQESHLRAALAEQKKWGGRLGDILVRMNLVSEEILVKALSKQLGIPAVNIETLKTVPPHVLAKVPHATALDLHVVPLQLRDDGRTLVVAMDEPQNLETLDHLRAISKARIIPQLAATSAITRAITRFYEGGAELDESGASFKVINLQGETLHNAKPYRPDAGTPARGFTPPAGIAAPRESKSEPLELLKGVEEVQRKEVAALKAMVELLIEKGVFTRDEYLAKVKR